MPDELVDLRKSERYLVVEPLAGTFGGAEITITNIGLTGLQVVHPQPVRIGTRARLAFTRNDVVVTTQARVVWSHLSRSANASGKLLYNTGIRIEASDPQFALAIHTLFNSGVLQEDVSSMDRKRERQAERELRRKALPGRPA